VPVGAGFKPAHGHTARQAGGSQTRPYDPMETCPDSIVLMDNDRRQRRDLHAFDEDGMVLCNPRDKEAAHRAQVEGIATEDREAVTCRKCLYLLYKAEKALRAKR